MFKKQKWITMQYTTIIIKTINLTHFDLETEVSTNVHLALYIVFTISLHLPSKCRENTQECIHTDKKWITMQSTTLTIINLTQFDLEIMGWTNCPF